MMINLLYSMIMSCSMMFMQMNHPLSMGLTLLIQTTIVCLLTGLISKTYWFSYILFLIFLGGMLVLFIYVTSLASNEMFSLSMKSTILTMLVMTSLMLTLYFYNDNIMKFLLYNNETISLTKNMLMMNEMTIELNKLYNFPTNIITIMLIIYLLITLIVIVKITNLFYGPLRMMS